jgi:hypothetical protein
LYSKVMALSSWQGKIQSRANLGKITCLTEFSSLKVCYAVGSYAEDRKGE